MSSVVEVRCPLGPRRLLSKLRLCAEAPRYLQPDNLIELPCTDCARRTSRQRGQPVRVLHRYNFLGELVATVVQER